MYILYSTALYTRGKALTVVAIRTRPPLHRPSIRRLNEVDGDGDEAAAAAELACSTAVEIAAYARLDRIHLFFARVSSYDEWQDCLTLTLGLSLNFYPLSRS